MAKAKNPLRKLARYLVFILRHKPQEIGLTLGENGFVEISLVQAALSKQPRYSWIGEKHIRDAVASQKDKQRLQIEDSKIRARYGHSTGVPQDITYSAVVPPSRLYHGTARHNIEAINDKGLLSRTRKYVHLSDSKVTAQMVGSRHSQDVVIITIDSEKANRAGIEFYHPESQIWLSEKIPPEFLEIPEQL